MEVKSHLSQLQSYSKDENIVKQNIQEINWQMIPDGIFQKKKT